MRFAPLVLIAMLAVACSKPTEKVEGGEMATPGTVVKSDFTPESMAKAMGIPLYPGSTAPDGMSSAPEKRNDGSMHYSMVLATPDSVDAVGNWYGQQTKLQAMPGMGGKSIVGSLKDGTNVIITVAPEAGRTLIRVKAITYAKS